MDFKRIFFNMISFSLLLSTSSMIFDYYRQETYEKPYSEIYFNNHRSYYECIGLDTTFTRFGTKCYVLTCKYLPDGSIYDFYVDVSTYLEYGGTL